jgi:hypothetical protein
VRRFHVIAAVVAIIAATFVVAVGGTTAVASSTSIPGNASTVNAASYCSGATAWHFVLPAGGDSPRPTFVSITAMFKTAGTVTYSGPFTHNGTQTPDGGTGFVTPTADTLLSATAVASGADEDDFFVLSSIICSGASPSTISTAVFDAAKNAAWAGTEVAPGSAYDTSTVTAGATGTVSYSFFSNGTCAGNGTDAGTVAMSTHSSTESRLAAGSYSFRASYNGDGSHTGSTGACESFNVAASTTTTGPIETSITTVLFNAATNATLVGGNLGAGGSVYDTSTVTAGATGTVSYTFYSNATCHGTSTAAGTDLAVSTKSTTEGPLTPGSYSFKAVYTSDDTALFTGSTSACETLTVVSGGVAGSTASPSPTATPTGAVLAATGSNSPAQGLAVFLIAFGLLAMTGAALAWRRRRI